MKFSVKLIPGARGRNTGGTAGTATFKWFHFTLPNYPQNELTQFSAFQAKS